MTPSPETTILVVDDEPLVHEILVCRLRGVGYGVLIATDGEEGLQMVRDHQPDLVVADYRMPFMDGLAMCRGMLDDPTTRDIPVLVLTSQSRAAEEQNRGIGNIVGVVPKPFQFRELSQRIAEALAAPSASAAGS